MAMTYIQGCLVLIIVKHPLTRILYRQVPVTPNAVRIDVRDPDPTSASTACTTFSSSRTTQGTASIHTHTQKLQLSIVYNLVSRALGYKPEHWAFKSGVGGAKQLRLGLCARLLILSVWRAPYDGWYHEVYDWWIIAKNEQKAFYLSPTQWSWPLLGWIKGY